MPTSAERPGEGAGGGADGRAEQRHEEDQPEQQAPEADRRGRRPSGVGQLVGPGLAARRPPSSTAAASCDGRARLDEIAAASPAPSEVSNFQTVRVAMAPPSLLATEAASPVLR